MQIIINSVYISSDDVNGWTQARTLSRCLAAVAMGGFFDDDEERVRVCTANGEQCLIYAFSICKQSDGKTFQADR